MAATARKLVVNVPPKFQAWEEPSRYKVAAGGRGSAKSHTAATLLCVRAVKDPIRVLCAREIQKNIHESVHQLLRDKIAEMNLGYYFDVQETCIKVHNGGEFGFAGVKHNVQGLKSWEGADYCWVEEANKVSKRSWDVLIPTIRKDDSEIWITYNPELEEDYTHQNFFIDPQPNSIVLFVNWRDNPWFPAVLEAERLEKLKRDPDAYENIWEGKCVIAVEGAIYAKEMRWLVENSRITVVPHERGAAVHTAWDFGYSDATSIIFYQFVGFERRIIDHISDSQRDITDYLMELDARKTKFGYSWGIHNIPHDGNNKSILNKQSAKQIMEGKGYTVRVIPRAANAAEVTAGIDAARRMLKSTTYIDKAACADLLTSLRRYAYAVNPDTGITSRVPKHDEYSHDADALRCMSMAPAITSRPQARPVVNVRYTASR